MRSQLSMAARLCCVFLFLQLLSCTKFDLKDLLNHPDEVSRLCDIKKITTYEGTAEYPDTTIATFYYNKSGNPEKVLFNHPATGRPHLYFRYNKQGKLTDYYGPYREGSSGSFEFWYRYQYDTKGKRIVSDSVYSFGNISNGEPVPYPPFTRVEKFTYDQYDRVIRVERTWINQGRIEVDEYAYDSKGNRTDHTYGDKPNLHRTNNIWMIVDRDYSVNNSLPGVTYNKYGLPLTTSAPSGTFLYQIYFNNSVLEYNCK